MYPKVSVNGGPALPCYLEMDGIAERAEWSIRYEVKASANLAEFHRLIDLELKQHELEIRAVVEVCEGVKFVGRVHLYTRFTSDGSYSADDPMLDVTIMNQGPWSACTPKQD